MKKLFTLTMIFGGLLALTNYDALAQHEHGVPAVDHSSTSGTKGSHKAFKNHELHRIFGLSNGTTCNTLFHLHEAQLIKFTLPDLTKVKTIDLPEGAQAQSLRVAGECSDPSRTVLVAVTRKNDNDKYENALLSYSEDLEFISEIVLTHEPVKD